MMSKRSLWPTWIVTGILIAAGCSGSDSDEPADGDAVPEITLLFPNEAYDPVRAQIGLMVAQEWRELGLDVTASAMDYAALNQTLSTEPETFGAFIAGYASNAERFDPDILLRQPFLCSGVETGANYFRYCNETYDQVIEDQAGEVDEAARRDLVWEAQQILRDDAPALPLYHLEVLSAWNSRRFDADTPFQAEGPWYAWTLEAEPLTDDRVLKVGQTFDIGSANPFVVTDGGNIEYFKLLYDTLTYLTPQGETVPWAASEWTFVDPTTVEVTLRSDLAFHDGQPVTAEDVAYSYELFAQGEGQAAEVKPFLDPIESIDVVDDTTLTFHLSQPYAPLATTTFSQIFILPKHVWEGVDSRLDFANDPLVGSGPFRWDYWRKGEEISLLANPDHFSAPAVDGLLGVTYSNSDAVFRALVSEEIDIEQASLLVNQYEELADVDHIERSALPDIGVYYLGFNVKSPPFDDPDFRRALAYTIPYDRIVDTLFNGFAEPGEGFIAPANELWHNSDLEPPEYDPEQARTLLEEAGYRIDGDRLLMPETSETP